MQHDDIPLTLPAGTKFDDLDDFCQHRECPSLDEDGVDMEFTNAAVAAFILAPSIILCVLCAVAWRFASFF